MVCFKPILHKINLSNKYCKERSDYFRQNAVNANFSSSTSWIILNDIEQSIKAKIEAIGTPLKDWDINIYRGILTGYNEAFIIDGKKKDELISADPKSGEIIRPILRGRDIQKYSYNYDNLYLLNIHNGIKEKGIKAVNINDFSAIKTYLDNYYPQLEKRSDKGDTPYNLRNCAYMEDFSKQKIVWGEISDKTKFCIELEGSFVTEATTFFMVGDSLLYLIGYLNSKLSQYIFSKIGTTTGVGTVRWKKFTVEQLPVPKLPPNRESKYVEISEKIILLKSQHKSSQALEGIIDSMIYEDFNFTNQEIEFIENQKCQ
ncbi:hypothetical protein QF023_000653 [Chryseobacterium sp. SLBN-27]|uniref:TaqI-like C-terminal specificity domain-containing protein n=1 Tax=Chryseobacterium sp. SLBN-27 TaxID=3042287 RepID=UPI0028614C69|nr:TaqI-like C-terminal specificity domain-containing protein [Chryseobacterium sp. SLBN-27]MDR6157137.1 hypothetical protein [Chryseobacterium sp. SLBN-27]